MPKICVGLVVWLLLTSSFPMSVFAQSKENDLTVSALVAAQPTDFQNEISSQQGTGPFNTNTTLTYTITYGSHLAHATSLTLEADWTAGTIQGNGTPSVEILEYVVGSATNGYGGVSPVIDTTNRKITWTFSSFPANTTDQTVTFQLKTTSAYTGNKLVTFSVSSTLTGPGVTVGPETINQSFQIPITPTAVPATSAPITQTPTPTGVLKNPIITRIAMQSISATKATVFVGTNVATTVTLSYGTTPATLQAKIRDISLDTTHQLELAPLTPGTRYYFRVSAVASNGTSATSDIFTFVTAKEGQVSSVDLASVVLTSSNIILISNPNATSYKDLQAVIPQGILYEFRFKLLQRTYPKVSVFVEDAHVLGIRAFAQAMNSESTVLVPFHDGTYQGQLVAPFVTGSHMLVARIEDSTGAISETPIASVTVVPQLTVVEKGTTKPLEHVKVTIRYINPQTNTFELLSPQLFPIDNPSYTGGNGRLPIVLPFGKYQFRLEAPGYKTQESEVTITSSDTNPYSTIELEPSLFSVSGVVGQYSASATDFTSLVVSFLDQIFSSSRFFELLMISNILLFLIVTFLSLSFRLKIPFWYIPLFFTWRKEHASLETISGKVRDKKTKAPIPHASVYVVNLASKRILTHVTTNAIGTFAVRNANIDELGYFVVKEGYEATKTLPFESGQVMITLESHETKATSLLFMIEEGIGMGFEVLLMGSFAAELLFLSHFGLIKTIPFIIISLFSLGVWTVFLLEKFPMRLK